MPHHWLKQIQNHRIPSLFSLAIVILAVLMMTGGCKGINESFPTEAQVEASSLDLINAQRGDIKLPNLILDDQLTMIARAHSIDMRDRGYLSQITPEGKTLFDRLRSAGVSFVEASENIADTEKVADPATFANTRFLNNPPDRVNILNSGFTKVGIGVARSGDMYWITEDFIQQ